MRRETGFDSSPAEHRESNAEDSFYDFAEALDDTTRQTRGYKKIMDQVDESGDFDRGLQLLKEFVAQRSSSMDTQVIQRAEAGREINREGVEQVIGDIRSALRNKDRFLGKGATGAVFTLRTSVQDRRHMVCAKVVHDTQQYAQGVTVHKELGFLDRLRGVEVRGVRTPTPLFSFSGKDLTGLAMEHLDAVNFERVLQGETTEAVADVLPEGFDVDEYFDSLRAYVEEMHHRGIIHNDFYLRNMMIDRGSGLPRVIDFGRSNFVHELESSGASVEQAKKADFDAVASAERKVRSWLEGKA